MKSITLLSVAAIVACSSFASAGDIIDLTKKSLGSSVSTFKSIKVKENSSNQKASNYAEGEVIVLFKDNFKITSAAKEIMKKFTTKQYKLVNAMWVKSKNISTKELIKYFKSSPLAKYILSIEPNFKYRPIEASNDTYYSKLWAVENKGQKVNNTSGTVDADMDIKEAWDIEKGSHDEIVAVLDTGVDYTHNDLSDNMYAKLAKHGYDFAGDNDGNNDDDPMPDTPYDDKGHYHGTHVAGIIGAVGDNSNGVSGVNQNVQIMAVKVFRPNGYGYSNDILEGLDFVADRVDNGDNIVAINASYGGGGGSQDDATNKAIKKLGEKGVVFCAAAGNDGKNIDNDPTYPASYNASNIITVAASDQDDKLASFSNWGKKSVDVAAPGTNILSTYPDNQYAYLQGTSMATPYVTGSVALLSAYDPEASVSEKIELLKESVDKKSAFTDKVASDGRVNIYSALKADDGDNGGGDNGGNLDKNHAPVAKDDSASTAYETAVVIDVLQNDSDADGDNLTVESVTNPANGAAVVENGKVKYTPNAGYSGQDSFNYTVSDGNGGKATAKVTVTVEEKPNTAPEAKDDSVNTAYETAVVIDVLKNDSDADGDNLSIQSLTNPKHGSVKVKNAKVEYTPDNGYSGDDSFTYTITDGKATDSATVSVEVEKKEENNNGGWLGGLFSGWSLW